EASINNAEVTAAGNVLISAQGHQSADALVASISVSTYGAAGASVVQTTDNSAIRAGLGDDVKLQAAALRIDAYGQDAIFQHANASSGGVFIGIAGADSVLDIGAVTLAGIGARSQVLAQTVQVTAKRDQDFDATSENLAVGLLAGSGARVVNTLAGQADVLIGNSAKVDAETVLIEAQNLVSKRKFSATQNSLRSTSAGGATISVLGATTNIGNSSTLFGAQVRVGQGAQINTQSTTADGATLRLNTLTRLDIVDKVRVDGVGGLAINYALAEQTADTLSDIVIDGAALRNYSGNLELSTRTDATMLAASNVLSVGAISGAKADALSDLRSHSDIVLNNAELLGTDVKLYAGQSRDRVSNQLDVKAQADMSLIALWGLSLPKVRAAIEEYNAIALNGSASVRAVRDIDLIAEPGIGGNGRARTAGLVLNLATPIYAGTVLGGDSVLSVNTVTVGPAAKLEAGVNYHTELQLLPILVDGQRTIAADRLGKTLNAAELLAQGLDPAQRYEYAVLDLESVAIGISTGNIVELVPGAFSKGVANQAYVYKPPAGAADSSLALES
ncbi:MAG: hypothetical protein EBY28_25615, partial [Betaproteobacteria bacterium]|nr:hypothetical protein [Betaproteobacteria bacterium]